jgi:hypothetical protein
MAAGAFLVEMTVMTLPPFFFQYTTGRKHCKLQIIGSKSQMKAGKKVKSAI